MDELRHRIERKILAAFDPAEAAEWRLQRAIVQTRYGEFNLAQQEILDLRANFGDGNYPRISILILIAEGLILYFRDLSRNSINRVHLAFALAKSLQIRDLTATASSWLAHLYYNFDLYEKLSNSISETLPLVDHSSQDWIPRISLVVADALQLSGNWTEADEWYHMAHRHSTRLGDRLTLGAIIFNRLAVGLSRLRADYAANGGEVAELRRWTTEASSAEYFHRGLSMHALPELLTFCNARAAFLEGKYDYAAELYGRIINNDSAIACGVNSSLLTSEVVLCKILDTGNQHAGPASFDFSLDACDGLAVDDRMVYHANLVQIQRNTGDQTVAPSLLAALKSSESAYQASRKNLTEHLERIRPTMKDFLDRTNLRLSQSS